MRIWWVLHYKGWRSHSVSFGTRNDSSCRTRALADPGTHEGLLDLCEQVPESLLSLLPPYLNSISQWSFLSRKTYNSRCTVKGGTNSMLSTVQGPLVFIIMKIFWENTAEFVWGNHSALSTTTEMQNKTSCKVRNRSIQQVTRSALSCRGSCLIPVPPQSGNRRRELEDSKTVSGLRLASYSTCIYIKATLSWNMQISLLMGFLCKVFLEPES